jgi:hypothetical protein
MMKAAADAINTAGEAAGNGAAVVGTILVPSGDYYVQMKHQRPVDRVPFTTRSTMLRMIAAELGDIDLHISDAEQSRDKFYLDVLAELATAYIRAPAAHRGGGNAIASGKGAEDSGADTDTGTVTGSKVPTDVLPLRQPSLVFVTGSDRCQPLFDAHIRGCDGVVVVPRTGSEAEPGHQLLPPREDWPPHIRGSSLRQVAEPVSDLGTALSSSALRKAVSTAVALFVCKTGNTTKKAFSTKKRVAAAVGVAEAAASAFLPPTAARHFAEWRIDAEQSC